MKPAFGLLTVIIFIVIIAVLGTYTLQISSQGIQETNDVYLKTQANILNKSALEFATYQVRSAKVFKSNQNCLKQNFIYLNKGVDNTSKVQIKESKDNALENNCAFKTIISYDYYNTNACSNSGENYLPNHKLIVRAEAMTTTCKSLDGWSSAGRETPMTNKISVYNYKIIGK